MSKLQETKNINMFVTKVQTVFSECDFQSLKAHILISNTRIETPINSIEKTSESDSLEIYFSNIIFPCFTLYKYVATRVPRIEKHIENKKPIAI